MNEFETATNVTAKREALTQNWNYMWKQHLWGEKTNLGTNVKIGTFRYHKNAIRTLVNQYLMLVN